MTLEFIFLQNLFPMVHFDCDYMSGAHPEVLDAICRYNAVQTSGYGADKFCDKAKDIIREACDVPEAGIEFLAGGTQTNATVIDALLGRTQGVIAVESGHINVHEAGAIELCGHKVITLPSHEGKMCPSELGDYLRNFFADETWPCMVCPGAVYISFPTELGTIYTRPELESIHSICREYNIPLFIDGARLGFGLAASEDLAIKDIAHLCDVFYIGGTKMGAIYGEAAVCTNPALMPSLRSIMKAHGAIMAKGKFLGIQFAQLFTNDLYYRIGRNGVDRAMELRRIFEEKGFRRAIDSPTNQQFFVLPNELIDRLLPEVSFEYWGPRGEAVSMVRFVTSWETTPEDIEELRRVIG